MRIPDNPSNSCTISKNTRSYMCRRPAHMIANRSCCASILGQFAPFVRLLEHCRMWRRLCGVLVRCFRYPQFSFAGAFFALFLAAYLIDIDQVGLVLQQCCGCVFTRLRGRFHFFVDRGYVSTHSDGAYARTYTVWHYRRIGVNCCVCVDTFEIAPRKRNGHAVHILNIGRVYLYTSTYIGICSGRLVNIHLSWSRICLAKLQLPQDRPGNGTGTVAAAPSNDMNNTKRAATNNSNDNFTLHPDI